MDLSGSELAALVQACKDVHALPPPLTDDQARVFFSEFSLERLFRALSVAYDKESVLLVSDALGRVLATNLGHSLLPDAAPYLDAASTAPLPPLRRLAAEQYGNLLMARVRQQQGTASAAAANGASENDDDAVTATCLDQLVRLLTDADTAVAAAAARAVVLYGSSSLGALRRLLGPGSTVAAALAAAAASDRGGTVRLRVLALGLGLAAGGVRQRTAGSAASDSAGLLDERLGLLQGSGLLQPLLQQLADPSDALACLAALQLLEELLAGGSGGGGGVEEGDGGGDDGMAAALAGVALPQLLRLVSEPTLSDAAMPLVAGIVRRSLPEALSAASVAAAFANGAVANGGMSNGLAPAVTAPTAAGTGLLAAPALLAAVRAVLDDTGDASAAAEACGLDALGTLGQSRAGAQLVLAEEAVVRAACERALGRSPRPEVRCAGLHALASLAGLERAGRERNRGAALLPAQCEEVLRRCVFSACALRRPAELLLGWLTQPFAELRMAAYRCIAALALRSWFAVELVTSPELLARLTDASTESGAAACSWRHAAAAALWATLAAAARGDVAAAGEEAYGTTLAAPTVVECVRKAVLAGPYGTEGGGGSAAAAAGMHEQHFVATRGGGGGV